MAKKKKEESKKDKSAPSSERKNTSKKKGSPKVESKDKAKGKEQEKKEGLLDMADEVRPGYLVKVVHLSPDGKRDFTNKGIVLRVRGEGKSKTFTVRSNVEGVGMEKVYNFASPALKEVEILKKKLARRARLYFLRSEEVSASKKKQYLRGL
jgi:large subunit ribosomal protein L19